MNALKYISIFALLLVGTSSWSQVSSKYCLYDQVALEKYGEKDLDAAKIFIDSAILMCEELRLDAYTHHIKGFIYYDLYKRDQINDPYSTYRNESFDAFLESNRLDSAKQEYTEKNNKGLRNIAVRYQLNVSKLLDARDYKGAIAVNNLYKEILVRGDIKLESTEYDIAFYNTLGDIFTDIYETDKVANISMVDSAITYFQKGLSIDSLNFFGNLKMGILYHNMSIDIILSIDDEADILEIYEMQEKSLNLGMQSLPYLKNAHEQQPKNKEVLYGLAGIYFMLQEKEKSEFYQNLYNELTKQPNGEGLPPEDDN